MPSKNTSTDFGAAILRVRHLYDRESWNAGRAELRACKTIDDIQESGRFWEIAAPSEMERPAQLAPVVLCFDAATQKKDRKFATELRRTLYPDVARSALSTRALRFRRLLACEGREELVHHLRRLLRHASQKGRFAVDWSALGKDIVFFGDGVRKRWAEDFYTAERRNQFTSLQSDHSQEKQP